MFYKKAVLKNFAFSTEKTPVLSLYFIKVAGLQAFNFIEKDSYTDVFL